MLFVKVIVLIANQNLAVLRKMENIMLTQREKIIILIMAILLNNPTMDCLFINLVMMIQIFQQNFQVNHQQKNHDYRLSLNIHDSHDSD